MAGVTDKIAPDWKAGTLHPAIPATPGRWEAVPMDCVLRHVRWWYIRWSIPDQHGHWIVIGRYPDERRSEAEQYVVILNSPPIREL